MRGLPRLAAVDEANLVLDHPGQVNVFLVAGLLAEGGFVHAGGVLDVDAVRRHVGERIATLPQLRRVAVADGHRHRWAEAPPDLEEHIRLVAAVGGLPGLERLCGELMSVPLPRDRPMWELLLVPGAGPVGVAMVLRIHHALADGMAAVAIVQQIFHPGAASVAAADAPRPAAVPALERDLRSILARAMFRLHRMRLTLSGREVGSTVLLGERSARRGVTFLDAGLTALEENARVCGATVNDALLAAVAAGYRAALTAAGEGIPDALPVSVPVALRRRGTAGNQVGVMLVRLPLRESDPQARIRNIARQTKVEKTTARQQGTLEFMRGPVGARLMDRLARRQHMVAGFVTNVPGPSGAVELAGARIAAIWPVAVLAANVRLGVAAISYDGRLYCGVHFDPDHVAGAEFARGMKAELDHQTAPNT
ncbi:wax ester/triacylglycerol synthase domain-containing protein [Microbacterium terregens]|uniref:diacylglycerol O-acyltransferase n=1 Tax=Microbacterium terregens TaxID=69363 RepID=A0ABV5SYG2_9MICO